MRRWIALVGVVLMVFGVLGSRLVAASSRDARILEPKDIRLLATTTEQNFVDSGEPAPSLGDMFVFHNELSRRGEDVGHGGVACTLTSAAEEFACQVNLSLQGGQIAVQGLLSESGPEPHVHVLPITGGSGVYRNVHGQMRIAELSEEQARLTLRLLP
jgi:hypothetical protein